jgi:hypothetical protein
LGCHPILQNIKRISLMQRTLLLAQFLVEIGKAL